MKAEPSDLMGFWFEFEKMAHKVQQFRRHPDWRKAFHHVIATERFLTTLPDGRRGIMDEDASALMDAVDQRFFDTIGLQ